jgi:hypothetical protein
MKVTGGCHWRHITYEAESIRPRSRVVPAPIVRS